MSLDPKREALDKFSRGETSLSQLNEEFPNCACEDAASRPGGFGPVDNEEVLRWFLTSPSQIDARNDNERKKRPFKAAHLKRAYKDGLSTNRASKYSREEIERAASILYTDQAGRGPHGGILAVVDFPAFSVRRIESEEGAITPFCVLETPADEDQERPGVYLRPSHADVVAAEIISPEDQISHRSIVYNNILRHGRVIPVENVTDCDLIQFLPMAMRAS